MTLEKKKAVIINIHKCSMNKEQGLKVKYKNKVIQFTKTTVNNNNNKKRGEGGSSPKTVTTTQITRIK